MEMHIGILQCDHVTDDLVDAHGDYQDMFSDLLHQQDKEIEISVYDLTADQFPVDLHACDGYIITGSHFSAYGNIPWINKAKKLVTDLYQAEIPTIGICFGHQLIAESLGGKVKKAIDKGWGLGVQHWELTNPKDWMGDNAPESFSMRASHQDQVVAMPADSNLIASSDFCPIAGFQTGSVLALQGHPEFSKEYSEALINSRTDLIEQEVIDNAKETLKEEVDSNQIGAWMVNFIKQSRLS